MLFVVDAVGVIVVSIVVKLEFNCVQLENIFRRTISEVKIDFWTTKEFLPRQWNGVEAVSDFYSSTACIDSILASTNFRTTRHTCYH